MIFTKNYRIPRICLYLACTALLMALSCLPRLLRAEEGLRIQIKRISGLSSWYHTEACAYNPDPKCPTASGESLYDLIRHEATTGEYFAASWHYNLGDTVRVSSKETGKSIRVRIADRGPAKRLSKRVIDLSKAAFSKLDNPGKGLIEVEVTPVRS